MNEGIAGRASGNSSVSAIGRSATRMIRQPDGKRYSGPLGVLVRRICG